MPEIMEYSVALGNYTMEEIEWALAERPTHAAKREEATLLQRLSDCRVIAIMHRPMADGGSVATYEDITDYCNHFSYDRLLRDSPDGSRQMATMVA